MTSSYITVLYCTVSIRGFTYAQVRPLRSLIQGIHVIHVQALQQHETIKGAVKWHVFCGDDPAGPIFKDEKLVDYEERHLRKDNTKPGDTLLHLCRGKWLWMLWRKVLHISDCPHQEWLGVITGSDHA